MTPLIQSKNSTILPVLIALTLGCFGLSPQAQAIDPPPDGGYPSETTGEGENALFHCGVCNALTAIGFQALFSNTTGEWNTAIGANVLPVNTTGSFNTAVGTIALFNNTTGNNNTAVGSEALRGNNSGNNNIALGNSAGSNLITGSDNIDIGNVGVAGESGVIRIGTEGTHTATYIAGINEAPLVHGAAVAVGITPDGQLGVRASSARFKESVKPMDKASEAIFSLQPVTFRYKKDPAALPQFGLVAEEVAKVNPDLVARDVEGKPFTVRYDEINAMLLNEFLKEHRKNEQQEATIAQLNSTVAKQEATAAHQQKQIEALTATVQKVSAQVEMSRPAPQTVVDNH
jgi:uncharacterized coiled-coil protein SlyX